MIACMCTMVNKLAKEKPKLVEQIGLLFVIGEEAGHTGMMVRKGKAKSNNTLF